MNSIFRLTYEGYRFGAVEKLPPQDLQSLVSRFIRPDRSAMASTLGGRRSVSKTELECIGPVVVKHYRRGGFLSQFVKATYLKQGKPRCQIEFEQMQLVSKFGVSAPEPVAFAYRGNLFYQAWLITKEIRHQQSMAQLCIAAPDLAQMAIQSLCDQVSNLLDHGILHADFHPGNVLVDRQNRVYIIDFDKAANFKGSRERLKKKYIDRWRRAVDKHGLPKMLDDLMRTNLR